MENEDSIQFEAMPDFGTMFSPKNDLPQEEKIIEKEYDSLYDELLDKCYPGNYKDEEIERFNIANNIYGQLKQNGRDISEHALRYLRNRAIDELGIHISTSKIYNRLKSLIDPENFIKIEPYNWELVEKAKKLYDQLKNDKDDIRALESIENLPDMVKLIDEYLYHNLSPNEYIKKYPYGSHYSETKNRLLKEEKKYFIDYSAAEYLEKYPNGIYKEEALCYKNESPGVYLKKYPNGIYKKAAKEARAANIIGICMATIMGVGLLTIIIISCIQ